MPSAYGFSRPASTGAAVYFSDKGGLYSVTIVDSTSRAARPLTRRQLLALDLAAPGSGDHWIRVHRSIMACRFEIVLPIEAAGHVAAAREALDEADRLEAILTIFRETSEVARVNRTAPVRPVAIGQELFDLLALSKAVHARTGGAFDVTSTPLSRRWGFLARDGRVPRAEELDAAGAMVGMERLYIDAAARTVRFDTPGMELNFGGIGKGFALDAMGRVLRRHGARDALLSAGGSSVLAIGGGEEGWPVDIRSRRATCQRLARLRLRNGALGTSGAGEQFVEVDGARYGHVLDPRTGWPAAGVLSASVVAADAAVADAVSTAILIGGVDLASRYCAEHRDTLALVTPDDGSETPMIFGSYSGAVVEASTCI